ncbi:MAG: hypothetical protein K9M49_04930 [Candidatus Marinimicrobia bacterium]|nr:hypothetical protein [Candidatus Neomarinimicrobiota bacterium]MCF7850677.1 hypothetical protein [Candidatus Neomarinimicrobiota bacterium]MCF7904480.1 hypothetical protein [Candidatus Neomarinimicrobiota bacterium]
MLWGLKTVAIFDVWSLEHLLSGISIGALAYQLNRRVFKGQMGIEEQDVNTGYFDIIMVLFLAYAWEVLEHYLEIGLFGSKVEYWFQGVEYWANRMISDPLMTVIGYYIARAYAYLVNPARIVSLLWLFVHFFLFPHSMYLHELL